MYGFCNETRNSSGSFCTTSELALPDCALRGLYKKGSVPPFSRRGKSLPLELSIVNDFSMGTLIVGSLVEMLRASEGNLE